MNVERRVTLMWRCFIDVRLSCDRIRASPQHFHLCHEPNHSGDHLASLAPAYPREIAGRSYPSASCRLEAVGHTVRGLCWRPIFLFLPLSSPTSSSCVCQHCPYPFHPPCLCSANSCCKRAFHLIGSDPKFSCASVFITAVGTPCGFSCGG